MNDEIVTGFVLLAEATEPKHEWLQLPMIIGSSLVFVLVTWLMWGKDWDDRD